MGWKNTNSITENEGGGKSKAIWNDDLVAIYCVICVKEVAKGNMLGTHFDKIGWVNVVKVFKEITGRDYDRKQLKNKWDSLKTDWKLWSSLLHKETGIGWDPAKKTVDAPPEWWQSKIKMNVEYQKFCDVGISPDMMDMYDKMFKGSTAVGNCVMIPSFTILPEEMVEDSEHDKQTVDRENEEGSHGQGIGNRNAQERFQRLGETVSRYFDVMLDILYEMAKDCIGVIDGVHVQASISPRDQVPYIGWEGSAHDSILFLSALRDPQSNFSKPPNGVKNQQVTQKYLIMHILHLEASLSALLGYGKKWRILHDMPSYSYQKQVKIVIATMAIHNYIRRNAQRDRDFDESANYSSAIYSSEENNEEMEINTHEEDGPRREMEILRNSIT
ncbi:hypothetical protein Ddye_008446 [Dipteronia dyeriana]|uniref:Myb/SANT-like domain-containing protein n=1 Tax=Dipteronia dyeriana TaxID=168575 RepID=A0AAD9X9P4_9ROSI|nr:hypothetical protein Ddye_008446 [Dipteronia dyeriana]